MNKDDFILELSKLRPNSTFLTIKGYRNEYSEIADYSIVFHISYQNALQKSIHLLQSYIPSDDLHAKAKEELLNSFQVSLKKIELSPLEEREDGYLYFKDENNNYIKGVKLHLASDTLHLYGLVSQKKCLIAGMYPTRNKRELTRVKDKLRNMTPIGRFRQFRILPQNVDSITIEHLSLLPPE